ncbi:cobaltochelatase subunit CobN [Komagataeibacter intermedius]|uniref:Cobaltochelatase subunit CobN n=4 Tax=Komagataeibacter intermedius TaxID=66229 RepID=A0A0N1FAJ0_9PROT|nr:cobaltochelatase subunit CobN [Komagataeibacter intermedius]KPH86538.1 cobaltochelatase subunit CobN [Komagataeibacter intermedius AF2]MCF3635769.1 cobaltochelatase subunit CobN [Komagataeibacter intermedius]GBQ73734.1 cobaltochelatase subunit CobN [Komagataeibacter intermedius NRIC 0521]
MHLLAREVRTLDDGAQAEDLGHAPADIVFLSFSDSDLLCLDAAHMAQDAPAATLRMATLSRLLHPMSIDLYVADTIMDSRCVVVRLLGGVEYWRYGAEELSRACRQGGIPLAFVAGDGRDDPRLAALSTVPDPMRARLDALLRTGGTANMEAALRLMAHLAGRCADDGTAPVPLPPAEVLHEADPALPLRAMVVFYRAHLLAGDIEPVTQLAARLARHGMGADLVYVTSLKNPESARIVATRLTACPPDIIINATFFSARSGDDSRSPLDLAGVPVLQVQQPGIPYTLWRDSVRGLSQADLAMQVVLPELDGRIPACPISFKEETAPGLPARHVPYADGINLTCARAVGWARLGHEAPATRRVGIILSDYPGAQGAPTGQAAHAVGLDSFASLEHILRLLRDSGYDTGDAPLPTADALAHMLARAPARPFVSVATYRQWLDALPATLRDTLAACWGAPEKDPAVTDGRFCLRHVHLGHILMALQPDRGATTDRHAGYHDPDTPPRHAYVAFYLWLRHERQLDAMVHLGTHGTLEWLPGKAAAPSATCWPSVLVGGMPVIYPFIVNNPGEAAAARRRLGAVTIGHMTPPIVPAGSAGADTGDLERLIDEYAAADGLDRRRGAILRGEILQRADSLGLLNETGLTRTDDEDEALARLDAYLCDVKDLQIRDGLHVFGNPPPRATELAQAIARSCGGVATDDITTRLLACGPAESAALLAALDGRFVPAGPAGAPTRGRADVLPTGRNLYAMDPRAIPTRSAMVLAQRTAEVLLEGHLQDQGEPLCSLVIDLWGSASLRTGGEDLALALLLMGVRPVWDDASGRVTGIEVIPMAELDRPRVDVTLRLSGLFRDAFPGQIALFEQAVQAVAARGFEAPGLNPLAAQAAGLDGAALQAATARMFGAAPGSYGTGMEDPLARGTWSTRDDLGQAWLDGSAWTYGGNREGQRQPDALAARMAGAAVVLHVQDSAETDILESADMATHEGGMAAAASMLGNTPRLLHGDTSRPDAPRLRATAQEVARITRGRLTNPAWLAGMRRHGYRGAADIARGVEALHGFAATMPARFDRQFDLTFRAVLDDPDMDAFLRHANPDAHAAIRRLLADALRRDLWRPRSNSAAMLLDDTRP